MDQVVQRLKDRKFSMLTGDAGPLAVGAVVKFLQGRRIEAGIYCRRLKHMVHSTLDLRNPEIPDEILYGRAGLLLALLFVRHHLEEIHIEPRFVQLLVSAILASGKAMAEKLGPGDWPPLMYEWHGKKYLGAAHGLVGILHTLILARKCLGGARQEELDTLVQQTLNWLLALLLPSGNLPSSLGNHTDRLVHWCHGAPGLSLLLCQAYKEYKVDHYLEAAKVCADLIWQRGLLRKGCSICHGTAGNAYTFLYLYQITNLAPNLKIKLENAVERLQKILDSNLQKNIDTQDPSVYTGTAGIALLYFHRSGLPRKKGLIKVRIKIV
ncbi:hypothetical protein B566_EDAN004305 [Ephemera danica]|nr:hypothetical protein B566_EDAN004305 [Ephemera danica]